MGRGCKGGREKEALLGALKLDAGELPKDERSQQTPPFNFFINKWGA